MGSTYKCNKCGYYWKSRKKWSDPAKCPKCGSKNIKLSMIGTLLGFR